MSRLLASAKEHLRLQVQNVHACIHACIHTYIHTYINSYVCMDECMYVCMYYVCMYVCMYVCVCMHVYTCIICRERKTLSIEKSSRRRCGRRKPLWLTPRNRELSEKCKQQHVRLNKLEQEHVAAASSARGSRRGRLCVHIDVYAHVYIDTYMCIYGYMQVQVRVEARAWRLGCWGTRSSRMCRCVTTVCAREIDVYAREIDQEM